MEKSGENLINFFLLIRLEQKAFTSLSLSLSVCTCRVCVCRGLGLGVGVTVELGNTIKDPLSV